MQNIKEKWSELDLKTRIAYITAIVAFSVGWGLTIAGFCLPPVAVVADSILWILGQALLYAASVLGIGMYVTGSMKGMKRSIAHFMREEHQRMKEEIEEEMEEDEDGRSEIDGPLY